MRIQGSRSFAAPRAAVFRALVDPELVADALPGVGRVEVRDADHWSAQIAVPLLPRAPRLRFEFAIVERAEPERARLQAAGKSLGASIRIDTGFTLAEQEGGTAMSYDVAVRPGGLLGRVPDGVLQPFAGGLVSGLLAAVERSAARMAGA